MAITDVDAERAPRRPSLRQSFQSLQLPAYRAWFLSQVFSASGTMTQSVAMAWFLLRLTGSSIELGLMGTFTFLPVLLLSPHAGALVDRVDRRKLLIGTQSALGLIAAAAAAVIASGAARDWMLFLIAAATGTVAAADSTARQVYVVDLVGADRVASAIGLYEIILNVSRVVGPSLGGVLLATVGVAACCAVNAASYAIPLFVLLRYKPAYAPAHAPTARLADGRADAREQAGDHGKSGGRGQAAVSLRAGIRYAWRHGPVRVCIALAAASALLFNLSVALPVLATRTFHLGGGGYGLMMAAFGVGALPGALLAASGQGSPTGRRVGWLALATAVSIGGTAFAPATWLAVLGLGAVGCLSIWFIAAASTLVQLATAPGMRGRMMGLWTMALPGTQVVNGPLAGWVTQDAGPREGFALSGMALAAVALAGWRALTSVPRVPEAGEDQVVGSRL
jgi:MFS family permease